MNFSTESLLEILNLIVGILILIFFFFGILSIVFSFIKNRNTKKNERYKTFFLVKVPEQNEIEIKAAEQMFASLFSVKRTFFQGLFTEQEGISFEIVAKETEISFYVSAPNTIATLVEKQLNAAYPSAEIEIVKPPRVFDRGGKTQLSSLILAGPPHYPIRVFEDLPNDSVSSITNAMSKLSKDEVLALQIIIKPAGSTWITAGHALVAGVKHHAANPEKKAPNIDPSFLEGVEKKLARPGFDVAIRVVSISDDKLKADSHMRNLIGAFEQFTDVKYNRFKKQFILSKKKFLSDFVFRRFSPRAIFIPIMDAFIYRNSSVLNSTELATIFHLPNKNVKTPRINWLKSKRAGAPPNLPLEGLYLGNSEFRAVTKEVYATTDDRRRHFYIIGQTGTGKSEFMKMMAIQDIKNGNGVGFIDPHGSAIEDILTQIPENRKDDVILFDAGDEEMPVGINILESKNESQRHLIVNAFIALLYKLYDPNKQGIMGPMLERAIRNIMLTAMENPEFTMIEVLRLLIDKNFAKTIVPNIKDPIVKKYWTDELANTSEAKKGENLGYFVSKFDRFVTDRVMRNIIGQKQSAFDFREVMDNKKILLVNLSKGKIGEENSNFIGLLMVPRLLAAALSRADVLGQKEFPDFYLYVDEFQNFSTPDIATILSEARKYRLCMIMANQFVAQLSDEIKTAVFGNVGTIAAFRVGVDDAEYLEGQFTPTFDKTDLINLSAGNAYIRLLINNQPSAPFSLHVPWEYINKLEKDKARGERIRQTSRLKYGKPRDIVEEDIVKRTTAMTV